MRLFRSKDSLDPPNDVLDLSNPAFYNQKPIVIHEPGLSGRSSTPLIRAKSARNISLRFRHEPREIPRISVLTPKTQD